MSTIDHKNIDEWLFNFFEGNLNPRESEALKGFLNKNPALKADYDAWKNSYVDEPVVVYPNVDTLLKPLETAGTKRMKWIIALFVAAGLVLLYTTRQDNVIQSPSEAGREKQFSTEAGRKPTDPVYTKETNVLEKVIGKETRQLRTNTPDKDKILTQPLSQTERTENSKSGIMRSQSYSGSIGNPPPDSLEIIIKKQEPAPKLKNSKRSKKKKKELDMIRLTNTGF